MTAVSLLFFFFFNDTAPTDISPLPLHAALRISQRIEHARDAVRLRGERVVRARRPRGRADPERLDYDRAVAGRVQQGNERSEEHTSELQSRLHLVCRLLLEKKKVNSNHAIGTAS